MSVPLGVGVFICRCGATRFQYDLNHGAPEGWSVSADGSTLCPRCARLDEGEKPAS